MSASHACTDPHHHVDSADAFVRVVERACNERGLRLTPIRANVLRLIADAGKPVRYLAGRAVWQASAIYRGGEAKTDAKDAASDRRSIADARHRSAGSAHPR